MFSRRTASTLAPTGNTLVIDPETGRRRHDISRLPASFGEAAGAAMDEAWIRSPGPSIGRMAELEGASRRLSRRVGGRRIYETPEEMEARLGELLSPEEAAAEFGGAGLTFDWPVRRAFAEILWERRQEELARQSAMSRADLGAAGQVGMFGAMMLASMADPVNLAAAFVPVVGQARYAAWARQMGITPARAARGVVEGTVGTALVEPLVLAAARQEQADYGWRQSLFALAIGGVAGGGLHVAGGAAADAVRSVRGIPTMRERLEIASTFDGLPGLAARVEALPPSARREMLRLAVSQTATGQRVDVGRLFDALIERETGVPAPRGPDGPAPTDRLGEPLDLTDRRALPETTADALRRQLDAAPDGRPDLPARGEVRVDTDDGPTTVRWERRGQDAPPVQREDLVAVPSIMRDLPPVLTRPDGAAWRTTLPTAGGGDRVVSVTTRINADGSRRVTVRTEPAVRADGDLRRFSRPVGAAPETRPPGNPAPAGPPPPRDGAETDVLLDDGPPPAPDVPPPRDPLDDLDELRADTEDLAGLVEGIRTTDRLPDEVMSELADADAAMVAAQRQRRIAEAAVGCLLGR